MGGKDFELLLWWVAMLVVAYAFCKLVQLVYDIVRKFCYLVAYSTLYYLYKLLSIFSSDKNDATDHSPSTARKSSSKIHLGSGIYVTGESASSLEGRITIAVDATDKRAGGLLILPKSNLIHFYSLPWPSSLDFQKNPQPDKFEMLNAYLALLIFEKTLEAYRTKFGFENYDFVLKCDNNFCKNPETVYSGQKNAKWREMFVFIDAKLRLRPFSGRWIHEQWDDPTILMADKLSRKDCSEDKALPKIRIGNPENNAWEICPTSDIPFYPDHSHKNMSLNKKAEMEMCNVASQVLKLELFEKFDIFSE